MAVKDTDLGGKYEDRANAKAKAKGLPPLFGPGSDSGPSTFDTWTLRAMAAAEAARLAVKYGKGPPKSADEVLDFNLAMRPVLSVQQTCVLSAWLGGARKQGTGLGGSTSALLGDASNRQTAQEVCNVGGLFGKAPSVEESLKALAAVVPPLAALVKAKATAQQAKQDENERRNVAEDECEAWAAVGLPCPATFPWKWAAGGVGLLVGALVAVRLLGR